MKAEHFEIKNNGDSALTIVFNLPTSEFLTRQIIALKDLIAKRFTSQLIEIIPAYQSLTLCFNPLQTDAKQMRELLPLLIKSAETTNQSVGRLIEIPVCYAPRFALDGETVSKHCQLTLEQIIALHTEPEYLVHMLGFTPGFLYLGGLSEALHCPRKEVPSISVPAGSVGIGGNQTGIYPQQTPGGWQIIGRTPLRLFDPAIKDPFIAKPLDRVKFVAISEAEFRHLSVSEKPLEILR